MGSSILASLSEAGGNDPFFQCLGPFLPIHQLCGSCRNATHALSLANPWPIAAPPFGAAPFSFQPLTQVLIYAFPRADSSSGTRVPL
jgi:hypothetical protein